MATPLQILVVEDSADDALLIERELRRGGFAPDMLRVETELALLAALETRPWDIVISDFSMPLFDGLSAHSIVQRLKPDLPFIFVSGRIGEERAADAMRRGVKDYILKDNLKRLVPAIQRELEQSVISRGRRAADKALKESEDKFRRLVEDSLQGIFIVQDGRIAYCNPATARMFGYDSPAELTGTMGINVVHPDDRKTAEESVAAALSASPQGVSALYRGLRRDGSLLWYEAHAALTVWQGRRAMQWAMLDVTKRRQAEDDLRAGQRLLQTVFDTIPHFLVVKDKDGRYLMVNKAWCETFQLAAGEVIGRHTHDIPGRSQEKAEQYNTEDQAVLNGALPVFMAERYYDVGHGQRRFLQAIKTPLRDESGGISGLLSIFMDRTAEREAHLEADLAHARLSEAIESLPAAFLLYDVYDRLVLWNTVVEAMLPSLAGNLKPGLRFAEVLHAALPDIANAESDPAAYERDRIAQFRDNPGPFEQHLFSGRWIQGVDRRTSDGGTVCLRFDVTDLKNREAELRQAQKMEIVGQLTGGIAHDLNNLLQVMSGSMLLANRAAPPDAPEAKNLSIGLEACMRAADLTRQLLAFSRKHVLRLQPLDLNQALRDLQGMLSRVLPATIAVKLNPAQQLKRTMADRSLLEQVVMNLAVNARDAMPNGGELLLETDMRVIDASAARKQPGAKPGEYVMLRVRDTGSGMPPEILEHIFEPFYTTKEPGHGTGLGLSTAYGIVQQHEGLIEVQSTPSAGTTFSIYLPVRNTGEPAADAAPANAPVGGSESLLLVDDNTDVLRLLAEVLQRAGYAVQPLSNGAEAIAIMAKNPAAVDGVILDLMMPEMTGVDVHRRLMEMRPDLPVLFCSGWASPDDDAYLRANKVPLVSKPFTPEQLLFAVRNILDRNK